MNYKNLKFLIKLNFIILHLLRKKNLNFLMKDFYLIILLNYFFS